MNIVPSLIRSHHFLSPAILIREIRCIRTYLDSKTATVSQYHRCLYCPLQTWLL